MSKTFNGITEQQLLSLDFDQLAEIVALVARQASLESGASEAPAVQTKIDLHVGQIRGHCAQLTAQFDTFVAR